MAVAPPNAQQPATMQDIYDLEQKMLLTIGGLATKTDLDELATKSSMNELARTTKSSMDELATATKSIETAFAGLATKGDIESLSKSLGPKDAPFAGNACAT